MSFHTKLPIHIAASLLCFLSIAYPATAEESSVNANPGATAPLQGGVSVEDSQALDGQASQDRSANIKLYVPARQALFSFRSRQALSADDYRKMEYGILGIVGQKSIFSRYYTVTQVLPDCPAALAGVQVGDVQIQAGDHVFTESDSQGTYWRTMCGKAGTPVDIVVKRGDELLTFHLVRMNIEDIQNERIRRMYERMLSLFGPPGQ